MTPKKLECKRGRVVVLAALICFFHQLHTITYGPSLKTKATGGMMAMYKTLPKEKRSCWKDESNFLHDCKGSHGSHAEPPSGLSGSMAEVGGGAGADKGPQPQPQQLFFPKQCPIDYSYERIFNSSSPDMPLMLREFLPPIDFSKCNSPREEMDEVLLKLFFLPRVQTPFPWSHWWGTDVKIRGQNPQTLGKKVDWAVQAGVMNYMKSPESWHHAPPKPYTYRPNETHWARHLPCAPGTSSWDCMFGNVTATKMILSSSKTTSISTNNESKEQVDKSAILFERTNIAREIWNLRLCIFAERGCPSNVDATHVKKLLVGWSFRYLLPLNACEAHWRTGCQRNVVTLRNLDPSQIKHRVFLSIHMRMGDACDTTETEERTYPFRWGKEYKERPCILPVGYDAAVKRVTDKYGVTDILLASDSQLAFDWAHNIKTHDVHYLDMNREALDTHDKGWIEFRTDIGADEVDGALQEWNFLGNGHILIGGSCGKFTKTLYNIMVGRMNAVLPWVSVDGCTCFRDDVEFACK